MGAVVRDLAMKKEPLWESNQQQQQHERTAAGQGGNSHGSTAYTCPTNTHLVKRYDSCSLCQMEAVHELLQGKPAKHALRQKGINVIQKALTQVLHQHKHY